MYQELVDPLLSHIKTPPLFLKVCLLGLTTIRSLLDKVVNIFREEAVEHFPKEFSFWKPLVVALNIREVVGEPIELNDLRVDILDR